MEHCAKCVVGDHCQKCESGFGLDQNALCQEMPEDANCDIFDEIYCLQCKPGFFLDKGKCEKCDKSIAGCDICKGEYNCLQCKSGFFLSENRDDCINCTYESGESNNPQCGRCYGNTYFNPVTHSCDSCSDGCALCYLDTDKLKGVQEITLELVKDALVCDSCEPKKFLTVERKCVDFEARCITKTDYACLECESGYRVDNYRQNTGEEVNSPCRKCPDHCANCYAVEENGTLTGKDFCYRCEENYMWWKGECVDPVSMNCSKSYSTTSGCIYCDDGYFWDEENLDTNEGPCSPCDSSCKTCTNATACFSCADNHYFENKDEASLCIPHDTKICLAGDQYGCLKCQSDVKEENGKRSGYFLRNYSATTCEKCDDSCISCDYSETNCTSCIDNYTLQFDETTGLLSKCVPKPDNCSKAEVGYCTECVDETTFLNENMICTKCHESCASCSDISSCIKCSTGYFRLKEETDSESEELTKGGRQQTEDDTYYYEESLCNSAVEEVERIRNNKTHTLEHCDCYGEGDAKEIAEKCINLEGCILCETGYFVVEGRCKKCSDKCYACEGSEEQCTMCVPGKQYLDGIECIECSTIEHCQSCSQSGCELCEEGYDLSNDGKSCDKLQLEIIIPVVIVGFIIIVVCVILLVVCLWLRKRSTQKEEEKSIKPFKVTSQLEMQLLSANNDKFPLKTKTWDLRFGLEKGKAEVDKPVTQEIEIVNVSKNKTYFFEFISEPTHTYELDINPIRYTLKPGNGIMVNFTLTMICTAMVSKEIGIVAIDLGDQNKETAKFTLKVESDLSTKLDHEELKAQMPPIGEGAFGMVFKGTYRGQDVAIKKMKARNLTDEQRKEFNHEVQMMTQLRHQCVVNLIGAVYTEGEIAIVSEFAEYGSLSKLLGKKQLGYDLKVKFLEDACIALEYLHRNNIIHRDIKCENILIYSLNPHSSVCAKLTDFGTCKNVTDKGNGIELTRGIGTPTYMSPESLGNMPYSFPSDVYSFAICMYEMLVERGAYENQPEFDQPWTIPQFVIDGKRLPRPDGTQDDMWDLITISWDQNPDNRPTFSQILPKLTSMRKKAMGIEDNEENNEQQQEEEQEEQQQEEQNQIQEGEQQYEEETNQGEYEEEQQYEEETNQGEYEEEQQEQNEDEE